MDYVKAAAGCTRDEAPVCTTACPFHLDIRTLISRVRGGRFDSAYRLLRDALVFPEIALALCTAPCEEACERRSTDAAVRLYELERTVIDNTRKKEALRLNVPPKTQRVAVVGAGLSGLGCAQRFSSRGYKVTVYEKTGRLGGSLWSRFPSGHFIEEIERQFQQTACEFRLHCEVKDLDSLNADAVYVATGSGGEDFGRAGSSVFFGGGVCGAEGAFALGQGIDAVNRIETFLKTGIMPVEAERAQRPPNRPDPALLVYAPAVKPAGECYTPEEAAMEAARCLQCNCDTCARRCPLVRYYRRFPDRIAEETEGTVRPVDIIRNRLATRLVASCDQCGLCAEDCPQGIDLRDMLADAKQEMKSKGDMPEHFSAFWLEDMAHAGETSFMIRQGEVQNGEYFFFPGCRLGASDPRYVSGAYQRLLQHYPGTALLTDCCGAPAFWAGDLKLYNEKTVNLREKWEALGSPVPVCACPACAVMLKNALPGSEPVSLYSLDLSSAGEDDSKLARDRVSVFDPCASRFDVGAQDGVRGILNRLGFTLQPLAYEKENSLCCGWGGQYMIANPGMAAAAAARCASLADATVVTYCVNCRDMIAQKGRPVLHILDILLEVNSPDRKPPTHTRRRKNRELLLREMTGEASGKADRAMLPEEPSLYLDETLREKLSADWILEEDVLAAVLYCERQNRKVADESTGTFAGHFYQGRLTYWVEYKSEGAGVRLINAYAHKLVIEET